MTDWWSNIEREIDRLSEGAPDPWAEAGPDAAVVLTPDQVAFLEQLDGASEAYLDDDDWKDEPGAGDTPGATPPDPG